MDTKIVERKTGCSCINDYAPAKEEIGGYKNKVENDYKAKGDKHIILLCKYCGKGFN